MVSRALRTIKFYDFPVLKTIQSHDFPSSETHKKKNVQFGHHVGTVGDLQKVWFFFVFQGGRDVNLNRLGTGGALNYQTPRACGRIYGVLEILSEFH